MPRGRRPAELSSFIPEPDLILFGCRPLVPFIAGWHDRPSPDQHFHAPADVLSKQPPADRPWPRDRRCPTCRGMIGQPRINPNAEPSVPDLDRSTCCGWCHAMSPTNERRAIEQRMGAKLADQTIEAARTVGRAEASARRSIREGGTILTEIQRRQLWNGYKGGVIKEHEKVNNRAKAGREFLQSINQLPDFDLILDKRGKAVGRWSEIEAGVTDGAAREFEEIATEPN
jgi:hypothetical protein